MCPQGDPAPVLRLVRRDESRPIQPTLEALNAPDQATRPDQKGGCCDRVLWLCVVFWTVAAAGLRRVVHVHPYMTHSCMTVLAATIAARGWVGCAALPVCRVPSPTAMPVAYRFISFSFPVFGKVLCGAKFIGCSARRRTRRTLSSSQWSARSQSRRSVRSRSLVRSKRRPSPLPISPSSAACGTPGGPMSATAWYCLVQPGTA